MGQISALQAAKFAQGIYTVQDKYQFLAFTTRSSILANASVSQMTANIGGRFFRSAKDGFGLCALGTNANKGDAFVIFRGTTEAHNNADVISDARIGTQMSKTGTLVHIGFNEIFKSMLDDIRDFIKDNKKEITGVIHCIGHSLGGAVATLAADWLKSHTGRTVRLYTFGQPRTGMTMFSWRLTSKLKEENIHRVFHSTDPVPMVPIFPYTHNPMPGNGHFIPSDHKIVSGEAHKMKGYVDSVSNKSGGSLPWSALKRQAPLYNHEQAIVELLESKVGLNPENPKTWAWLDSALIFVLKKILGNTLASLHTAIVGVHTLADRIAWVLEKGINLAEGVSYYVKLFIKKVMQVLGMRPLREGEKPTRTFLTNLLQRLIHRAHELARKAMRNF